MPKKLHAWALMVGLSLATVHEARSDSRDPAGTPHHPPPPIEMPEYPGHPIVPTEPVGYVAGGSAVTPTGELSYRIPIDVPRGRAGLEPDLALTYASRGGNGIAGVGWSLAGTSAITLCPTTLAAEGSVDGVDFDGSDRFCLDGDKLVGVAGTYGTDHAEYRTERDHFTRIVSNGPDTMPSSFDVWTKDGRILHYHGVTAHRYVGGAVNYTVAPDGDKRVLWVLDEARDRSGNTMRYEYDELSSSAAPYGLEVLLKKIEYTGHVALAGAAHRSVELTYEDRTDKTFAYQSGVRFESTKRLHRISTKAPEVPGGLTSSLVRYYELAYEPVFDCGAVCVDPPASRRSRLVAVHECDAQDVCKWGRRFTWEHDTPKFDTFTVGALQGNDQGWATPEQRVLVTDFSGDGKDDVLYNRFENVYGPVWVEHVYGRTAGPNGLGAQFEVASPWPDHTISLAGCRPVDVDGDGGMELVCAFETPGKLPGDIFNASLEWDGGQQNFVFGGVAFPPVPKSDSWKNALRIVDMDGDARADVLRLDPQQATWTWHKNDGTTFGPAIPTGVPAWCANATKVVDLDGDGRGNILGFHLNPGETDCTASRGIGLNDGGILTVEGKWTLPDLPVKLERPQPVLADLNGDGLKDAVWPAGELATPHVAWNMGNGFAAREPLAHGPLDEVEPYHPNQNDYHYFHDAGNRVADMNGDGLDDIVSFRRGPPRELQIHFSQPGANGAWDFATVTIGAAGDEQHDSWYTSQLGDFNGDGLVDIVRVNDGQLELLVQQPAFGDVITEVWDDLAEHARETITYDTRPWDAPWLVATPACVYPQSCVKRGFPVVRERSTWQGEELGKYHTLHFDYADARQDLIGRGFLGFGVVRIWDALLGREIKTTFDNATRAGTRYPFAGLPAVVTDIRAIGEQLEPGFDALGWGPNTQARVTRTERFYQVFEPVPGKTFDVRPVRWQSAEWEEAATVHPGFVELEQSPGVPPLRERNGTTTYDPYGNVAVSFAATTGGVSATVARTYDNFEADWLLGLPKSIEESVTDSQGNPPAEPRRTELHTDPTTGLLAWVVVEPNHPDLSHTVTLFRDPVFGAVEQIRDEALGEAARWTYLAYEPERVFVNERYDDLLLYDCVHTDPGRGVPVLEQDPNGITTSYEIDGFGRSRGASPQGGEPSVVHYMADDRAVAGQPRGVAVSVERSGGSEEITYHDSLGRPWEHAVRAFGSDPDPWIHESVHFNLFGTLAEHSRPGFGAPALARTKFSTDTLGRTTKVLAPDTATTKSTHTMFTTEVEDAIHHFRTVTRDLDDRITSSADGQGPSALATTYTYGPFGQIEIVTSPQQLVTTLGYDKLGRRTLLDEPNIGQVVTTYNGFGEPKTVDDNGQVTTFGYDVVGRRTWRSDFEGLSQYVWDTSPWGKGKLAWTESADHTRTDHAYDSYGRPTRTTWTVVGNPYDIQTEYDNLGRTSRVLYPKVAGFARFIVEHEYNGTGYLAAVREATTELWEGVGNPQPRLVYQVDARNADSLLAQRKLGNGIVESRDYDALSGRLSKLSTSGGALPSTSIPYDYDKVGNVKSRGSSAGGRLETFEYDDLDRLTRWDLTAGATHRGETYHYDASGNMKWSQVDGGLVANNSYTHPGRPHLLSADSAGTYDYDAHGRQIAAPGRTVDVYTPFDLPRTITTASGATGFTYDAFDSRVRKSGPGAETVTLAGLYERREAGGTVDHVFYVQSETGPVAQVRLTPSTGKSERLFVETDPLGSIGRVTDKSGGLVEQLWFDPFGRRIESNGQPLATPPSDVKLGFTGHRHDDDLGLIDMKGRIYDPRQRRFLTGDPLVGEPLSGQSFNRYAYVRNNPLRYVDPSGFDADAADPQCTSAMGGCGNTGFGTEARIEGAVPSAPAPVQADPNKKLNLASNLGADAAGMIGPPPPPDAPDAAAPIPAPSGTPGPQPAPGDAGPKGGVNDMDRAFGNGVLEGLGFAHRQPGENWRTNLADAALNYALTPLRLSNPLIVAETIGLSDLGDAIVDQDPVAAANFAGRAVGKLTAAAVGLALASRETGSYTNTHASGKVYVGKGGRARSQVSGRRVEAHHGDPHVATDWTPASSSREAFKQESRRLDDAGGPKSPTNYNLIESPGKNMRVEDGELPK